MRVVVDSSAWISLARAGLLSLVESTQLDVALLDVVRREAVDEGMAGGHVDAAAIEAVVRGMAVTPTKPATTVDAAVLFAAAGEGALLADDVTLGRRARALGAGWLRSADLVLLARRQGRLDRAAGRRAVEALRAAGRLSDDLAEHYLEEMR